MKKISDEKLQQILESHKSGATVVDLSATDLSERDLSGVYLEQANLENASFVMADLQDADLRIAKLAGADFTYANLISANLSGADLTGACLQGAFLTRAQLQEATLANANLTDADLKWVDFREADLSNATVDGANFYLSAFDSWLINGVECTHVYWDQESEVRNPPNRDFEVGEFEELYKSLPTIEYYFEDGFTPIDALLIEKAISEISNSDPEFELELESYQIRGAIPRMRMTVKSSQYKEAAYLQLKGRYEQLALEHQEQRKQITDITLALISNTGSKYNVTGDLTLKNNIVSDNSNIMISSSGSSQKINNTNEALISDVLQKILNQSLDDESIEKSKYVEIREGIEAIKEEISKPNSDVSQLEKLLSNLGSVASISGLVGQLSALITP